jgi:hypothetical protein
VDKTVASIPNGSSEEIRFHITQLKGRNLVDIRIHASLKAGDEKVPTGKGIALDAKNFEAFKQAVLETDKILTETIRLK